MSVETNLTNGLTAGLAAGIGMAIVRTGCGVYEVVTFPFPCPEGYQPILEPVFVLEIDRFTSSIPLELNNITTGENEYENIQN